MAAANREAGITVHGGRELRKALEAAGEEAVQGLKGLNKEVAEIVAEEARKRAPVLSGKMRGSIKAFGTKSAARVKVGKKSVPYAAVIQWGWPAHSIESNPFMTDALAAKKSEVLETWEKGIDKLLNENGLR